MCSDYGEFKCPGDTAQEDRIFYRRTGPGSEPPAPVGQQYNSLAMPEMNLTTTCNSLAAVIKYLDVRYWVKALWFDGGMVWWQCYMLPVWCDVSVMWCQYGVMAVWCDVSMVWWLCDVMSVWCDGCVMWCQYGVMAVWCGDSVVWWQCGVMSVWQL